MKVVFFDTLKIDVFRYSLLLPLVCHVAIHRMKVDQGEYMDVLERQDPRSCL